MSIYRLIDASVNRVSEGLRVIEDYLRFVRNDESGVKIAKEMRHKLRDIFKTFDARMITYRQSDNDVGHKLSLNEYCGEKKSGLKELLFANFKRCEEALRTLEEYSSILNGKSAGKGQLENLRFRLYSLEKRVLTPLMRIIPEGLYCITASNLSNGRSTTYVVERMLDAGVKVIQYREKYMDLRGKLEEAEALRRITERYKANLIINDHPEIAMMVGADGIHIGQDDYPVTDLRRIAPDMIIGLSTHSPEQADNAVRCGADYIGVGPIFSTQTKDNVCPPVGVRYLEYAVRNIELPQVAIGGIKTHNLHEIAATGVKRVAIVSEITGSQDIGKKILEINKILEEYKDV